MARKAAGTRVPRRQVLGAAVSAAAVAAGGCGRAGRTWRWLTEAEGRMLAAVCDCIIPPDETLGAGQAGAANYIDIQLSGHFRKLQKMYRDGLAAFDAGVRAAHGKAFDELPVPTQMAVLERFEKDAPRFFQTLVAHTMQSYYGDPRHGGNRDGAGYRTVGLSLSPVRGRSHHDVRSAQS